MAELSHQNKNVICYRYFTSSFLCIIGILTKFDRVCQLTNYILLIFVRKFVNRYHDCIISENKLSLTPIFQF